MKYVCLVYPVKKEMNAMARREADTAPMRAWPTTRPCGRRATSSSPMPCSWSRRPPESTEQLGGFIPIEARDLNDAIQVAAKVPMARRGSIEMRPIKELKR